MYNKNLTDFANFEEYNEYMKERVEKIMQLKKEGFLENKKDDAGMNSNPVYL